MQHFTTSKITVDIPRPRSQEILNKIHGQYVSGEEIGTLEVEGIVSIHNVAQIISIEWEEQTFDTRLRGDQVPLKLTVLYLRKEVP